MRNLAGKLKFLKAHIKIWIKDNKSETVSTIANLKKELNLLDAVIDKGTGTEDRFAKPSERRANIDMRFPLNYLLKTKVGTVFGGQLLMKCNLNLSPKDTNVRRSFILNEDSPVVYQKDEGILLIFKDRFWEMAFDSIRWVETGDSFIPFSFPRDGEPSFIFSKNLFKRWGCLKVLWLDQYLLSLHMFYADDAIFLGEWSDGNISTLIHVLKCFFHASGLKINLNKSKIMGNNVESAQVIQAAAKLGCLVLKCPFYYLGTRVGGSMTRVQAWQEIVEKVKSRLSKWKNPNNYYLLVVVLTFVENRFRSLPKQKIIRAVESSKDVMLVQIGDRVWSAPSIEFLEGVSSKVNSTSLVEIGSFITIVPSGDRWNWESESMGIFWWPLLVDSLSRRILHFRILEKK
ncbi:hypothetical protein Tco_0935169 [Tanacetum coccineum]